MLIFQFQKLNCAYGRHYPRSWETPLKYLGVKINKWKVPGEVPCPALVMLHPGHTCAQSGTGQRGDPPPSTSSGPQPFSPGAQGQVRAVLAFVSLPGLSLQVEDTAKIRPVVAPAGPAPLWGKTNPTPTGILRGAGLCSAFPKATARGLLKDPGTPGGGGASSLTPPTPIACPPQCPYHGAGPSRRLGPSMSPSPSSFLEHSRGLASLLTFLGSQDFFPDPC